jgi:hypothetical protein
MAHETRFVIGAKASCSDGPCGEVRRMIVDPATDTVTHLCALGPGNDRGTRRPGRWLVNGSYNGLVELAIEPPCYISRQPSTLFLRSKVSSLTISLVDPDGFIAAVEGK